MQVRVRVPIQVAERGGRWLAATSVDLDAESDHDDVNEEGESADGCGDRKTFIEAADSASE